MDCFSLYSTVANDENSSVEAAQLVFLWCCYFSAINAELRHLVFLTVEGK
jgi:hypothetical protein